MKKHFCDVCGSLLSEPQRCMSIKMGRQNSPNPHIMIEEMCESCSYKIIEAIASEIIELKAKE